MAYRETIRAVALSTALVALAISFPNAVSAQECAPADITLLTQAEVDNFQASHGPCDHVTGQLRIEGGGITSLSGLESVTQFGDLTIHGNLALHNLEALSGLTRVGGNLLELSANPALVSLDGLESLDTVVGELVIKDNNALENIDALSLPTTAAVDPAFSIRIERNALDNVPLCYLLDVRSDP